MRYPVGLRAAFVFLLAAAAAHAGDTATRPVPSFAEPAPATSPLPPPQFDPAVFDELIAALQRDQYETRRAAFAELRSLSLASPSIHRFYPALKRAAARADLSLEARLVLASLRETARYTWLVENGAGDSIAPLTTISANPAANAPADAQHGAALKVSPVTPEQIGRWLADLSALAASQQFTDVQRAKALEWELLDALADPRTAGIAAQQIEAALNGPHLGLPPSDSAAVRLRTLREWSQPGLAAEFWKSRQNFAIQYLIVGQPSRAEGALRPSLFDRVEGNTAHCVSGNSLRAGEYPLHVAFPHPREQASFFRLIPLPTARERLIYQYETETLSDDVRLREITERTLRPALLDRRAFDESELWLLPHLDPRAVAAILRQYFRDAPDERFDLSKLAPMLTDVSSSHRTACVMLALDGTHDAVPSLVELARSRRAMELSTDEPHAVPWIAALAIAQRDPWDGVDGWLAELLTCEDRITFGQGTHAEVGATAAAILLSRHGQPLEEFGLVKIEPLRRNLRDPFEAPTNADYRRRLFEDRLFRQLDLVPYKFADAADASASDLKPGTLNVERSPRSAVQNWWTNQPRNSAVSKKTASPPSRVYFTARAARP